MAESSDELKVSRFYGVYLLCSQSPLKQYAGKCYVGFTVNPNRRINQHNRGRDYGGARKTSNRGPWKMVLIVHGFPNNIAALQFEWAWQQPSISTRLKGYPELKRKKPKESFFQYNFRILSRMLSVGPWNRLPLTVRWLEPEYEQDFEISALPPSYIQIASGKVSITRPPTAKAKAAALLSQQRPIWLQECHLCMQSMRNAEKSRIGCLNVYCTLTCHLICLANYMISSEGASGRGHYIPIAGLCPLCDMRLTWTELLENKRRLDGEPQSDYDEEEEDEEFDDSDVECLETEEDSDRNASSN